MRLNDLFLYVCYKRSNLQHFFRKELSISLPSNRKTFLEKLDIFVSILFLYDSIMTS